MTEAEVSVILPTFNEAETIVETVHRISSTLSDIDYAFEVLVVDDDSPDGTADLVRDQFGSDVEVTVRTEKEGLASAVVDGFEIADGDVLVCMDADGQHPPERLPQLVESVRSGADLAVASRHSADTDMTADWGMARYITSFGGALLAWIALPPARQHLQDPMSGYFAVERKVVNPQLDELNPRGYKVMLEVLGRCPVRRVAEVPCEFHDRAGGESNLDRTEYIDFAVHALHLAWVYRTTPTIQRASQEVVADGGS